MDALVDKVIHATGRDSLDRQHACARPRAARRLLRHSELAHHDLFRVAHWDKFGADQDLRRLMRSTSTAGGSIPGREGDIEAKKQQVHEEVAHMLAYALRRILLIMPTLFAIILVNFVIVQAAPGGPVDQLIAELKGTAGGTLARVSGGGGELASTATSASQTRGARGLDPEMIKDSSRSSTASTSRRSSASS